MNCQTSTGHVIGPTCYYDVIDFVFVAKRRGHVIGPTYYYDVTDFAFVAKRCGGNKRKINDVIITYRSYNVTSRSPSLSGPLGSDWGWFQCHPGLETYDWMESLLSDATLRPVTRTENPGGLDSRDESDKYWSLGDSWPGDGQKCYNIVVREKWSLLTFWGLSSECNSRLFRLAFRRLKKSRSRELSPRSYALHSVCPQLSFSSFSAPNTLHGYRSGHR